MCRCELGIGIFRCVHLGRSLCLLSSVQVWQVFCLFVVCVCVYIYILVSGDGWKGLCAVGGPLCSCLQLYRCTNVNGIIVYVSLYKCLTVHIAT